MYFETYCHHFFSPKINSDNHGNALKKSKMMKGIFIVEKSNIYDEKCVFFGGFSAITCLYVHGTKRNFQGDFMVQKYTFLFLDNVCYLASISTWDMVLGLKTTVYYS